MQRLTRYLAVATLVAACVAGGAAAHARAAATICVGGGKGCYQALQPAFDAAHDGDTIKIAPGTYAGGVTIDKSLKLIGAGASSTTISGGGPVLTIGVAGAASEPTVSVDGLTVTAGVTVGNLDPSDGRGGGIYVPRAAGPSTGATVTIRNTVIRGNTVAPRVARDSGIPCPPDVTVTCIDGDLPFASAGGGGISNDGTMTLDHTLVTDNRADAASGLTSDADGGGILDRAFGSLTLHDSVVTDNHAEVTAPNGRFVDSGGILNNGPMLTIDGSLVSDNSAQLTAAFPNSVETGANTAGVHIQGDDNCADPSEGCTVATIRDSTITGNSVTASNSLGDAVDFCGGICDDGVLTLSDSLVGTNHVTATVPSGSTACACADSAGIGTGGIESIANTRVTGNTVVASAPDGTANASSGGGSDGNDVTNTISDSVFSGNQLIATTTSGMANVQGAGFTNGAVLTIRGTTFSDNAGTATGPDGSAQGGGIWNGNQPGVLTLLDDQLMRNTLNASTGISAEGGGLFTTNPVTIKNAVIANNVPDQCFGC